MVKFEGETFRGRTQDREFSGIEARNCAFNQCHLPAVSRAGDWNRIRDVTLVDASQWNCSVNTTAIENVSIHNLKRAGDAPLFLWCCVFKAVELSGRVSAVKINRSVGAGPASASTEAEWDKAVSDYYQTVDWALDISEAKFPGGVTFEAIPGRLIRRNPETQVLVTRDRLANTDWRAVDFDRTAIDLAISWFLQGSLFDDVVLAARCDPKWAKRDIAVLEKLRATGVAELD